MSKLYDTDLDDAVWAVVEPQLPAALPGGRPRTTNLRAVNAIFYLLRTGCQWRLLPREYPPRSTVYHYFSTWRTQGVWTRLQWALHKQVRVAPGRAECPTVVIMDGQSVKTTERGGTRGFDGHKRVKGRKRHILVDMLGLPIASRVEPANISDRKAGLRLLGGLRFAFPNILLGHPLSPRAWEAAQLVMGELPAAIVVAAILLRGAAIASAGGYLRELTRKAEAGEFSLGPMLMALLGARNREKKRA